MRILLAALGTIGDVQPLIALAIELRSHGHQPIFALPLELLPYPKRYGFKTIQIGPDLHETQFQDLRLRSQGQKQVELYEQALSLAAPQIIEELVDICKNFDVLISSTFMRFGRIVHELSKIPFVSTCSGYPLILEKDFARRHQEHHNNFNTLRIQLGLSPLSDFEGHTRSPQLALLAISRVLLSSEHVWLKRNYHITGNFFIDQEEWEPDQSLASFLQAGPPPVVISMGSMVYDDPVRLSHIFFEAIKRTGCRAVLQSSWTGLAKDISLPETIYRADFIPNAWLFPRSACVISHAGVGTTVEALRAGVPSVLIPHTFDHFAMAQRVLDLGCASRSFTLQELDADQLSVALSDALTNSNYTTAAVKIGKCIEADKGVQTARLLIEQLVEEMKGK